MNIYTVQSGIESHNVSLIDAFITVFGDFAVMQM